VFQKICGSLGSAAEDLRLSWQSCRKFEALIKVIMELRL
jgi:hypothetical protein